MSVVPSADELERVFMGVNDNTRYEPGRGARTEIVRSRERTTPIVRTGHAAIDAALATERTARPTLDAMVDACVDGPPAAGSGSGARTYGGGRPVESAAFTLERDGRTPALHVSTVHAIVDRRGRSRRITVWHELGSLSAN